MKKYSMIAAVLVLTATVLAGCRNPNGNVAPSTMPPTKATTMPATSAPTTPSTNVTESTGASEQTGASENGNHATTVPGGQGGANGGSTESTGEGRARTPQSH